MGTTCICKQKKTTPKNPDHSNSVLFTQTAQFRSSYPSQSSDQQERPNRNRFQAVDPRKGQIQISQASSGQISNRKKSLNDLKMIQLCLHKHSIFRVLDKQTCNHIMEKMKYMTIGPRQFIFQQNQPGQNFYCVASGKLEVLKQEVKKDIIRQGGSFGQLALLQDSPRNASIRTIEKCSLWVLDRESFKQAIVRIHEMNADQNRQFIQSVILLQMLTGVQKQALVDAITPQYFNQGQTIIKQGELGDLFFIIKEGTVICTENNSERRSMTKGDYFGQLALLYNSARTATITAVTDVKVISIGRNSLIDALGDNLDRVIYRNTMRIAMDRSEELKVLSSQQKEKVVDKMEILNFQQQTVIRSGDPKNSFIWIVLSGFIEVEGISCTVFNCIGVNYLRSPDDLVHQSDIVATAKVHFGRISKTEFERAIGGKFEQIISFNESLVYFSQIQIFRSLPTEKLKDIIQSMKTVEYQRKQLIVQQNTPGEMFYVIQSGIVEISKNGVLLRTIGQNDFFGQRSLLFDDIRQASVKARTAVKCWVLEKPDFNRVTNQQIRNILMKRINLQDESIQLSDLIPVKTLGRGMFGHVYLTVHRSKHTLYSLKSVSRPKAIAFEIYENLNLERDILLQLDHVFIMKLVKTFKDANRLYFLMEYVDGMDLFDVMRVLKILREADARFYISCLVTILEYLHARNIIYRDLKPENVMVDDEGYPKLIDFGTARILKGRTYTFVGTPHYMAPQVIMGKGYTLYADWWSLGVMLYEFLYNKLPFGEEQDEPRAIYQVILESRLVFPRKTDHMSPVRPLIQQLLSTNPSSRLNGSITKFKQNSWFVTTNWDKVLTKQVKAPYIPKQRKLADQIALALNKQYDLQNFIDREEGPLDFPSRRKNPKPPPKNWDKNF